MGIAGEQALAVHGAREEHCRLTRCGRTVIELWRGEVTEGFLIRSLCAHRALASRYADGTHQLVVAEPGSSLSVPARLALSTIGRELAAHLYSCAHVFEALEPPFLDRACRSTGRSPRSRYLGVPSGVFASVEEAVRWQADLVGAVAGVPGDVLRQLASLRGGSEQLWS